MRIIITNLAIALLSLLAISHPFDVSKRCDPPIAPDTAPLIPRSAILAPGSENPQGAAAALTQKIAGGKPIKTEDVDEKMVDQVKQTGQLVHGTTDEKKNMHGLCERCFQEGGTTVHEGPVA